MADEELGTSAGAPEQAATNPKKRRSRKSSRSKGKSNLSGLARYRIERELGSGSMGVIHLAHDLVEDRDVAVKELSVVSGAAEERRDEMVQRFEREAQAARSLESDNVVRVLDSFEDGDRRFLVMEYLDGPTLDMVIKQGPMPAEAAISIATQVLKGLAVAHEAGIVHRDLKPSNIFVMPDGVAKVADFGVAHLDDSDAGLTQAGQVLGTLDYMSPEQVRGETVDARADIFAAGVILYEMLVGANPFRADQPTSVMYRIAYEEPPSLALVLSGLPENLQPVIVKATAKDQALRYQSAVEMVSDLENGTVPDTAAIVAAAAARAAESNKKPDKPARKPLFAGLRGGRTWIGVAVAVAILVVGALGGYAVWSQKQQEEAARRVAVIREGSVLVARIADIKTLRTELASAVDALSAQADANQSALSNWDKVWQARQSSYDAAYSSVQAYNDNEDVLYQASAVTYYTYAGGYTYTIYTYTPHYRSFPKAPTRPAKVKANLSPQQQRLTALSSQVASLDASSSASNYFPMVIKHVGESDSALQSAVSAASYMAAHLVTKDSEKGDVVDQSAISSFDMSKLDAAIKAMDSELDLYLGNYKVSRSQLGVVQSSGSSTP